MKCIRLSAVVPLDAFWTDNDFEKPGEFDTFVEQIIRFRAAAFAQFVDAMQSNVDLGRDVLKALSEHKVEIKIELGRCYWYGKPPYVRFRNMREVRR